MAGKFISRGFKGRRRETDATLKERMRPGQYETKDFPVLSAGPTPRTSLERWNFSIYGEIAEELKWTWDEFQNQGMYLITPDLEATRAELVERGVDVSEPFHFGPEGQTPGLDPGRADYNSLVSFSDPDGNGWLIQEVKQPAPGR
jgi:hypothetical protein